MPSFSVRFRGVDRVRRRLRRRAEAYGPAAEAALFEEGEKVMAVSKRLTPVDEGVLRSSGHVRLPQRRGSRVSVELGFGGPAGSGEGQSRDVGYAVPVHEDLTAHHPVGQAKYLEQPVDAARRGFGSRFARRVRRILAGRG